MPIYHKDTQSTGQAASLHIRTVGIYPQVSKLAQASSPGNGPVTCVLSINGIYASIIRTVRYAQCGQNIFIPYTKRATQILRVEWLLEVSGKASNKFRRRLSRIRHLQQYCDIQTGIPKPMSGLQHILSLWITLKTNRRWNRFLQIIDVKYDRYHWKFLFYTNGTKTDTSPTEKRAVVLGATWWNFTYTLTLVTSTHRLRRRTQDAFS